ncbi:MAG: 30S ribosomal protein S8 [Gammaproteobacteria bacterium]
MSTQDPIADLLTRIRNAQRAGHRHLVCASSKLKLAITKVLHEEGYITGFSVSDTQTKPELTIELKYYKGQPVINKIRRISKCGRRIYKSNSDLPSVLNGLGIAIISTSKGVMTDKSARAAGVGGEVLCEVE